MSQAECLCFEKKLAFHSAPSLLGIKCANLISLDPYKFDLNGHTKRFNRKAKVKGLKIKKLCGCGERSLLLVYNEKLLTSVLSDGEKRQLLINYGYDSVCDIESDLKRLSDRIRECKDFPHEIGIFLGYPIEDILGFIENKGKNFKLCGCWKVYGDVESAKRTFLNYDKCRNFLCNKLNQGSDIYTALKIY